ncbi:MAG: hypothetical protein JST28_19625 [Acidobacteria bacterium]|nr:hypothetical protein [Acidobacteriota bacterium]
MTAIARFAPIVEIGAGTGYWASLMRLGGVDILCYDKNPPGHPDFANHFHENAKCWTEVLSGDDFGNRSTPKLHAAFMLAAAE